MADRPKRERDLKDVEHTTGPSRNPDTSYNAGHTHSMGFPDEEQGIVENVKEQQEKDEPRPNVWHGEDRAWRERDE